MRKPKVSFSSATHETSNDEHQFLNKYCNDYSGKLFIVAGITFYSTDRIASSIET